jgi:cytochrome P450
MPPDGLRVLFNLGDIGRDKATWTDPDEFRPERFLAGGEGENVGPLPVPKEIRMMPFGAGHRHCPGVGMGMMLIKCFLAKLVGEFEWAPARGSRLQRRRRRHGAQRVLKTDEEATFWKISTTKIFH